MSAASRTRLVLAGESSNVGTTTRTAVSAVHSFTAVARATRTVFRRWRLVSSDAENRRPTFASWILMRDPVTQNRSCGILTPFRVDANHLLTVDAKEMQTDFYQETNAEISVKDLSSKAHSTFVHCLLRSVGVEDTLSDGITIQRMDSASSLCMEVAGETKIVLNRS